VREVWLVVDEPSDGERPRHLEARVELDARPAERTLDVALADLRADPGRGPVVTAAGVSTSLALVRSEGEIRIAFPLELELREVGAPITRAIAVAGVSGRVTLLDEALTVVELDLAGGFSDSAVASAGGGDGSLWQVSGRLRRDLTAGVVRVSMAEFELGRIPEVLEGLPLRDSDAATVGGRLAIVLDGNSARFEGDLQVEGVNVDHPLLARQTVRDVGFSLRVAAEVDRRARRLDIDYATLQRRDVRLELEGELEHPADKRGRRYRLHARVPAVPCQSVLDAIPVELTPSLQGFALDGEFDMDVRVDVDYADLEATVLDGHVGIWSCKVTRVPPHAASERLAGGFTHRVTMRDGRERAVQLWSGSGSFTSLSQISPYMVQAVLTTEDGGFFRHAGFLPSQFRTALVRNLAAGNVRLGASTITMQTVKNVLLSHERTLSRKLQELFLTWYVEQVLTKQRIMELYLNVAELGPGIYGVTRAARHYFGKLPEELSPPEAAYLALMLPSPVRRHASYCRGELTPSMQVKLARVLSIMRDRGRLSEEDYVLWKDVPLQFDLSDRGDADTCMGQIAALLEAQEGQRAVSGLLGDGEIEEPLVVVEEGEEDVDPSHSDAPGRPAMDEIAGVEEELP
jgi:hypothetical protein